MMNEQSSASRPPRLNTAQKLAWLRLIRSENVGPITFRTLINRFGGAVNALAALPELSVRGGLPRAITIFSQDEAEQEFSRARKLGLQLIAMGEPEYPKNLIPIDSAPPLLYVIGDTSLLQRNFVAIVGSRNCSALGRKMTATITHGLGEANFSIVSGLARGVDTTAHEIALPYGTAAIMAGGVNRIYPAENTDLYKRIQQEGVILSEMPPDLEPRGRDFPRRNRIVAGMSLGTVVIEAAARSGSLITARMAAEQGRDVFAVPGSPLDPRAEGTNALIRDGATMARSSADIIEALAHLCDRPPPQIEFPLAEKTGETLKMDTDIADNDRLKVINALSPSPIDIDDLIRHTDLPIGTVLVTLLELELAGRIERQHGHRVALS